MKKLKLLLLKITNLLFFLHGLFQYLIKVKNSSFAEPPKNLTYLGFIDKNLLWHIPEHYQKYFRSQNLHNSGAYTVYKPEIIGLVLFEDTVLIKKAYMGSLKDKVRFFREIKCFDILGNMKNLPRLYFVDYKNYCIYIQYIDGDCLQRITGSEKGYSRTINKKVKESCTLALNEIHENRIAVIDVQAHNIIYESTEQEVYFIDFADAIYGKLIPGWFMNFLYSLDTLYLKERVLKRLSEIEID